MGKSKSSGVQLSVLMDSEVARQIRQHARSNNKTEVCGVLIGEERENSLVIEASIAGANAAQAGTHVTFTQDTWEHIYKVKDRDYPGERIVGWYHSHPGFGVFLSDHDTFIHKNFFSSPAQVAWVYDPHSDEEGCFGWAGKRIERLSEISFSDRKGGEGAGETGKPEPMGAVDDFDEEEVIVEEKEKGIPAWLGWTTTILSYVLALALGFLISWVLFPRPRPILIPVDPTLHPIIDPRTGRPILYEPSREDLEFLLRQGPSQPAPTNDTPDLKDKNAQPLPGPEGGKDNHAPKQ